MFCKNCGQSISDGAGYCQNCGMGVEAPTYQKPVNPDDKSNILINILSFFIPLVGIILYFVKRDESPKEAKGALKAALISIALSIVFSVLMVIGSIAISFGILSDVTDEVVNELETENFEEYEYEEDLIYDDMQDEIDGWYSLDEDTSFEAA